MFLASESYESQQASKARHPILLANNITDKIFMTGRIAPSYGTNGLIAKLGILRVFVPHWAPGTMNPESEIRRLLDVMPASGRMSTKISAKADQATVIQTQVSFLRLQASIITINFGLWSQLTQPQRDMLILSTVAHLRASNWLKLGWYQGATGLGVLATMIEAGQGDAVGVVVAAGLSAIATTQIWQNSRGVRVDLDADQSALLVAQRRGYSESEAAQHLLSAIEAVAHLEGQTTLTFNQLIRCQNLRAIAQLNSQRIPTDLA